MRVLICNDFVRNFGGTDVMVRMEERALRHLGHHVGYFALSNAAFDRARGIAKAALGANCIYSLPVRRDLRRVLAREYFHVVHVHNTVPFLTGAVYDALRTSPAIVIQHLHNHRAFCLSGYAFRAGHACDACSSTAFAACAAYRCYHDSFVESAALTAARWVDSARGRPLGFEAHAFIANSRYTKSEHVRRGFPEERIRVVENAAEDLATLRSVVPESELPPAGKLTYVGSLLRAKGVFALLDVAEAMPDWTVQIIGTGPDEAALRREAAARRLGNVCFTGFLTRAAKASAWADSFATLVPSLWRESFGLVAAESFSLSVPVVTTGAGGLAEIVDEGVTGHVRGFNDPRDVAGVLRALWGAPERAAEMKRAARRTYERRFSADAFTERFAAAQARILAEPRRPVWR